MMSYSSPPHTHYLPPPPPNYYPSPPSHLPQDHVSTPQSRQETTQQRKRPKYTRSKTGCLTCRVKKVKCDEEKPVCVRCRNGQRDCTWPEGLPTRKKSTTKADLDGRPSTAGSSVSGGSTPPTKNPTPPPSHSQPLELDLPPLASRRTASEPYLLHPLIPIEPPPFRRHDGSDRFAYSVHPSVSPPGLMNPPENSTYHAQNRYNHSYIPHPDARSAAGPSIRSQWHASPLLTPLVPYYPAIPNRNSMTDHQEQLQHRYQ